MTGPSAIEEDARRETMNRKTAKSEKKSPTATRRARRSCAISIRGERHRSRLLDPMRGAGDLFAGTPAADVSAATRPAPQRQASGVGFSLFYGPV
jgi:hypothetical protein